MREDKRLKRKVRNSYIVSTISIALVLFLLGSVGYLISESMKVATTLQESISLTVELNADVDDERREQIEAELVAEPLVRAVVYSSKQQKAEDKTFRELFGQDWELILEENPLSDSFEVQLTTRSEEQTEVNALIEKIKSMEGVDRVSYPEQLASRLHSTVGTIRLVLLIFGVVLLVISLILLNNTIRLAVYSKRYLINTMKLVGATKWYIMRPFLGRAILQGVWAGLGASLLLGGALWALTWAIPELLSQTTVELCATIAAVMFGGGVLLSLLFTAFAINKFVNMNSSKIYLY